jgi:hypothetical protein
LGWLDAARIRRPAQGDLVDNSMAELDQVRNDGFAAIVSGERVPRVT